MNIQTPAIIKGSYESLEREMTLLMSIKQSQSSIIAQKCSFRDSFVDSDNFLNIDEKPDSGLA